VLTSAAEPLLAVSALEAGYGKIRVLHGIDLAVAAGEVVALLGPNGAGKTTLLRALSGLLPVTAGAVRFDGREMTNATPREGARAGRGRGSGQGSSCGRCETARRRASYCAPRTAHRRCMRS